ncbi:MAG: sensor histidine kinase [Anaerolineae bacterium]
MRIQLNSFLQRLSLAQRFMLASLIILVTGMLSIGWWVGQQIEAGVVHRTAATTALYVDSFISPHLQELNQNGSISSKNVEIMDKLLHDTPLGQKIVAFKVWGPHGQVLYSTDKTTVGQIFPMHEGLSAAWEGKISSIISDLEEAENLPQKTFGPELLEIYSPVRLSGTNQIIAVAEFYQTVDELEQAIGAAQRWSWLVVGVAMLVMYLLLSGFVQRASDTIARQQVELNDQVSRLTELLAQNRELHERVGRAAASVATLNERFLKRIGAELHDGPAQDLSLALLRLDTVISYSERCCFTNGHGAQCAEQLNIIQNSLQHALQEVRAIAAGLGLPQLNELNLTETVSRAVRTHERRTNTKVKLNLDNLPEQVNLPLKITLYRLVQESLTNAYRHAGGLAQQVNVKGNRCHLKVEVADQGPGFDTSQTGEWGEHLGLVGMRERVESLGGLFRIESEHGRGTKVIAQLSLQAGRDHYG